MQFVPTPWLTSICALASSGWTWLGTGQLSVHSVMEERELPMVLANARDDDRDTSELDENETLRVDSASNPGASKPTPAVTSASAAASTDAEYDSASSFVVAPSKLVPNGTVGHSGSALVRSTDPARTHLALSDSADGSLEP